MSRFICSMSVDRSDSAEGRRTHEVVDDNEIMLVQVVLPPEVWHVGLAHHGPTPHAADLCVMGNQLKLGAKWDSLDF